MKIIYKLLHLFQTFFNITYIPFFSNCIPFIEYSSLFSVQIIFLFMFIFQKYVFKLLESIKS